MKEERKISIGEAEYRRLKRLDERINKMKIYIKALNSLAARHGEDVKVKAR